MARLAPVEVEENKAEPEVDQSKGTTADVGEPALWNQGITGTRDPDRGARHRAEKRTRTSTTRISAGLVGSAQPSQSRRCAELPQRALRPACRCGRRARPPRDPRRGALRPGPARARRSRTTTVALRESLPARAPRRGTLGQAHKRGPCSRHSSRQRDAGRAPRPCRSAAGDSSRHPPARSQLRLGHRSREPDGEQAGRRLTGTLFVGAAANSQFIGSVHESPAAAARRSRRSARRPRTTTGNRTTPSPATWCAGYQQGATSWSASPARSRRRSARSRPAGRRETHQLRSRT